MRDYRTSVTEARVQAIRGFGFTDRQARFLVHVMVYSGVFLERQYCDFARIAHGQKAHDFVRALIDRHYVTVITPGRLHQGRLFHLQYKPLYEAIGEPNNRHRKPASMGRFVERLMLLDAVLADSDYTWLGTEQDKLAYFMLYEIKDRLDKNEYPHITFGEGAHKTARYFPEKLPIGVPRDHGRRHVFLYLVTRDVPHEFRMFLYRHELLLARLGEWTIRLLVPRQFRKAIALYRNAAREELASRMTASEAKDLQWFFRHLQGTVHPAEQPYGLTLSKAIRRVGAARFRSLYRTWQDDPYRATSHACSFPTKDHVERGWGRLEVIELRRQYLQLGSLVGVA